MRPAVRAAILFSPWSPKKLGSSLLGYFDAANISQAAGALTSWPDAITGIVPTQATGSAKPSFSPTGLNGGPCVTFDGVDDCLTVASVPYPSGAVPCELWVLADQQALVADATARYAFSYGDAVTTGRWVGRTVASGNNLATCRHGNGATSVILNASSAIPLDGRHVICAGIAATSCSIAVDGGAPTSAALVPATATARTRLGAHSQSSAASFHQGPIGIIAVTTPISTTPAGAQFWAYLKRRGGIV